MSIVLRPDQAKLEGDIYNSWNAGNRNVMAQAATGFGKSIVMSTIARKLYEARLRFPVIAHRNELVSQMSHHLARQDVPHRIIGADETVRQIIASHREEFGMSYVHPTEKASVAGIDTLNARIDTLKEWAVQQDYFFGDEGHHFLRENKWGRGVAHLINARGLLVTGTPGRPDGCGLGRGELIGGKWTNDGIVDDLVFGPEMRWLIDNGALTDYEIVCPTSDLEMSDDDITDGGDYSPKKLKKAAEKSKIVGDVVKEYCRHAIFKQAICFATDVETANKIAQRFNDAGIRAASVSAKTPTNVRDKYIKEFKRKIITVLVNVDLFDEGFDVPACDVVIMARPTASIVKYLQQFGRALRVDPLNPFKVALIIDHVSNWLRHGLPDKSRLWSLGRRDKRGKQEKDPEDIPLTRCLNIGPPACCKPYERIFRCCPHCGWEPPLPEPGARTIQMVDGDMTLLDRATLDAKRRAMVLEDAASVAQRVAGAAGGAAGNFHANKHIAKIAAHKRLSDVIAQWAGVQRAQGRPDTESYRRFYITLGIDVMDALAADRSREEFENMAATVEGWYR